MEGIIVKIVLGGSLIGMGTIIFRKIPVLIEIPEEQIQRIDPKSFFSKLFSKVKKPEFLSLNLIFQKILSRIKVLTTMVGRKTDSKLEKLKQSAEEKRDTRNDGYWEKLKESKNDKD